MIYDLEEFELNFYITRKCNINCSHCYIDEINRKDKLYLNEDTIKETIHNLTLFIKTNKFKQLNIGLYGGEITQMSPEYLNNILERIKESIKEIDPIIVVKFKAISNLISDSFEKYIGFIKKIDLFGISFDIEVNRFNDKTYKIWKKNLELLKRNNIKIILNLTITKSVVGKELFFLNILKEIDINNIHLGYYVPAGENIINKLKPTHKEHSDFIINLLELTKKSGIELKISPVESMKTALIENKFETGIICEIFNSLNFDTNGDISLCTAIGGNDYFKEQIIGNIYKKDISSILQSKKYYKELLSVQNFNVICNECEYKKICKQGCKILATYGLEEGECWGYRFLWDYLSKEIKTTH